MAKWMLRVATALLIIGGGVDFAWAQPNGRNSPARAESDDQVEAVIPRSAPGGGDMVVLGLDSRYVTRAWRDQSGQLRTGCAREGGAAVDDRKSEEER